MPDREGIMRKVRALLDQAASTTFDAERDTFLAKADEMMTTYVIESWELEMAKPANQREKPILREFVYGQSADWDLDRHLVMIFGSLARRCRVKMGEYGWHKAKLVGYESDLDWLEMLFTNIKLHLVTNMIPHVDPNLTYLENLAVLKEVGFKWQKIWEMLVPVYPKHFQKWAKSDTDGAWVSDILAGGMRFPYAIARPAGVRFTKEYTTFCQDNKRERIYSSPEAYRRNFLEGYATRIIDRLHEVSPATTQGAALVLANREEDLLEHLYDLFPDLRPHPKDCQCDTCHAIKCRDITCKRPACEQRRKPVRARSVSYNAPKVDWAARERGAASADQADLHGGRGNLAPKKQLD